jgi:hypothetical protein
MVEQSSFQSDKTVFNKGSRLRRLKKTFREWDPLLLPAGLVATLAGAGAGGVTGGAVGALTGSAKMRRMSNAFEVRPQAMRAVERRRLMPAAAATLSGHHDRAPVKVLRRSWAPDDAAERF